MSVPRSQSVFVLGASGRIGRRVCAVLDSADVKKVCRDHPPRDETHSITIAELRANPHKMEGSTVIYLAWDVAGRYEKQRQKQCLEEAKAFIKLAAKSGMKKIILAGTAAEFGDVEGILHEHQAGTPKENPYGYAKANLREFCKKNSTDWGLVTVWLRPFQVWGGEGLQHNLVLDQIYSALHHGDRLSLTAGMQKRDFVHVDDVARAFLAAVEKQFDPGFYDYNLGWGKPYTLRSAVNRIFSNEKKLDLLDWGALPRRAGEPDIQAANSQKANKDLNWVPQVELGTVHART